MKNGSISNYFRVAFIGLVCLSVLATIKAENKDKKPLVIEAKEVNKVDKRGKAYREVVSLDPTSEKHVIVKRFRDKDLVYQSSYQLNQTEGDLFEFDKLLQSGQAVLDGKTIVYASNQHRTESTYKNGILLVIDEYAENGCMIQRNELAHFAGDELIIAGEYKCWNHDGQLIAEGSTKNGQKHGVFTQLKGNATYHSFYVNGELVSEKRVNDFALDRNKTRKKRSLLTVMK